MATLHEARTARELDAVRQLFTEYARHIDAPRCFAGFEAELAGLPGPYFARSTPGATCFEIKV